MHTNICCWLKHSEETKRNISEAALSLRKNIWKLRGSPRDVHPQVLTSCLPLITAICTFFSDPSSSSNTSADHKAQFTANGQHPMKQRDFLFSLKNVTSNRVFLGIGFTWVRITSVNQFKFFNSWVQTKITIQRFFHFSTLYLFHRLEIFYKHKEFKNKQCVKFIEVPTDFFKTVFQSQFSQLALKMFFKKIISLLCARQALQKALHTLFPLIFITILR